MVVIKKSPLLSDSLDHAQVVCVLAPTPVKLSDRKCSYDFTVGHNTLSLPRTWRSLTPTCCCLELCSLMTLLLKPWSEKREV